MQLMTMSQVEKALECAFMMCNQPPTYQQVENGVALRLGIDLGTSNIVSMVLNEDLTPVAVLMDSADVVRDGIVWDFFGAVSIIQSHLDRLRQWFPNLPEQAITSYPPGTEARISANVLEACGLTVSKVVDEPSAVAYLLGLDNSAIVDIGGGTTGVAVVEQQAVIFSADEPTGGHHVNLTIAGRLKTDIETAEKYKKTAQTQDVWPIVAPVFEKMADIVEEKLQGFEVKTLYLSGGSVMITGVSQLFKQRFPHLNVINPACAILLTPYAIAAYQ